MMQLYLWQGIVTGIHANDTIYAQYVQTNTHHQHPCKHNQYTQNLHVRTHTHTHTTPTYMHIHTHIQHLRTHIHAPDAFSYFCYCKYVSRHAHICYICYTNRK